DGQYAAFGRVIEGMEAVDEIAQTRTGFQDRPKVEQKIKTIRLENETVTEPKKC
ncbi:MAG: peptidylprolyl isomerase, partial [Clostridia bacterium]|nr:peptidylprolyl isomerase [Clostridia bacterium]